MAESNPSEENIDTLCTAIRLTLVYIQKAETERSSVKKVKKEGKNDNSVKQCEVVTIEKSNGTGIYTGYLVNGIPEGYGEFFIPNGSKYYGEWKGGKPDGFGVKTLDSGEVISGKWNAGEIEKKMSKRATDLRLSKYKTLGLTRC